MKSFQDLVDQVPANGRIIANGDFPMARRALEKSQTPVVFYGRENGDVRIDSVETRNPGFEFTIGHAGRKWTFRTRVAGRYNVWNLTAGIVLGFHLGIDPALIGGAVESFSGVERRMTSIRTIGRTAFIEDFAHHPTAIHSVLESMRETDPGKKIVAIFEPRSWSMRRNFFQQRIASSFADADEVVICDVYEKEKIPEPERLDVPRVKRELEAMGKRAVVFADYQEIRTYLQSLDFGEDRVVVLLSNGGFGNLAHFIRSEL
jgi:UDP-N-acetylmuramate: L-alanyl-gamma-D-glutamyl-meso-diaminopimelate ligase